MSASQNYINTKKKKSKMHEKKNPFHKFNC